MQGDVALSRSNSASASGFRLLRSTTAIALAVSILALAATPAFASTFPSFRFSGAGYGHGIGLSQYGSKGFAEQGRSGKWIVGHYFPGTTITTPAAKTMKVNLDPAANYTQSSATYNAGYSATRWTVQAGWTGMGISLNGGPTLTDANGPYTFETDSAQVAVTGKDGKPVKGSPFSGTVTVVMKGSKSPALLQVVGRSGPFKSSSVSPSTNVRYRGEILISSNGSRLKLLNKLPMESYLYGVVPRESPASWHAEALKAQGIVARSYAYVGNSELYCDTRSQMYNGHSRGSRDSRAVMHEDARTNDAVKATAGTCVTYKGDVVATYFSSSSGGYTANKVDIWGGSTIAYLQGVPDPYGEGSYDPWSSRVVLDGMQLAEKIAPRITGEPSGAGSSVYVKSIAIDHSWPTGFAKSVSVEWSDGSTSSGISAGTWRLALGLKSTKFFSNANGSRIGDESAAARSVAASKIAFPTSSSEKCVIVVNADDDRFIGGVCGAALSGVASGPVLFVHRDSIPSEVAAEIKRLRASRVYIIGSTSSVSSVVTAKLKRLGASVVRLSGKDRYAVSSAVARKARELGATSARVVIVSDTSYRNAAVAAAIAGGAKRPLLVTAPEKLSASAAATLKEFKTSKSYVIGSTSAISNATVASVVKITGEKSPAKRFGLTGTTYDTAVAAAEYEVESLNFAATTVFAPSRYSLPDVLIASALSSATKRPFVYASTYSPPSATSAYLRANRAAIKGVTVVGKPTTVGLAPAMRLRSDAY